MTKKDFEAFVKNQPPRPCQICGRYPTDGTGVLKLEKGKLTEEAVELFCMATFSPHGIRMVFYGICSSCFSQENCEAVEESIAREIHEDRVRFITGEDIIKIN